jgi:hypothetical protein
MSFRNPAVSAILFFLFFAAGFGCKKNASPATGSGGTGDPTPAVTAVGTPVGSPVTKNMDASGGSLTSPDGKLSLVIPAGALSANTAIGIQPVTNTAPGGIGMAYQLLPEGTKFNVPVTLTYHYADRDVNGSMPYFLYIAYQENTGSWKSDIKQRGLDTVAKTVSITSTHFSIWSAFEDIVLVAGKDEYHEGESSYFQVTEILKHGTKVADGGDDGDELYSLPVTQPLPDNVISNWSLNGSGSSTLSFGNIIGAGARVTYNAPALIETETAVQVSVEVNFKETVFSYSNGKQIASFNKLVLFHPIELLPSGAEYTLIIEIGHSQAPADPSNAGYRYTDHATMDIVVDTDAVIPSVKVLNIQNFQPDFSIIQGSSCKILSVYPDLTGELNITSGYGGAYFDTFNVALLSSGGHLIKYDAQCDCQNCPVQTVGGSSAGSQGYTTPNFLLNHDIQNSFSGDQNSSYVKFTLTPK